MTSWLMSAVRVALPHIAVWVLAMGSASPAAASPFLGTGPSFDDKKLDELVARLNTGGPQPRRQALQRLLGARAADAPLLHRRLHRRTDIAPADYRNLLRSIGAHVPDHNGRFGPAPPQAVDWLAELLKLDRRDRGALAGALVETRTSVALMRALAATRRSEAAVSLLRFAYRHQGAFRDECGRLIRAMGDDAVPAMVRAGALHDPLAFKMKRYAAYQLDRMNRARPELALKSADPLQRVDLLHAYGETRTAAAVNAVLAKTNAAAPSVRRAARWAMLRYVSGRPPTAIRRHLKLAGGRQSDVERSLYLTYRELAHQSLARRMAAELTRSETEAEALRKRLVKEDDPRAIAAQLFAHFDAQRMEAQQARHRAAQQLARSGKLDEAIAAFDSLLLQDPDQGQSVLVARLVQQHGLALLRAGKTRQAALQLTKALALMPRSTGSAGDDHSRLRKELAAQRAVAEALRDEAAGLRPDWRLREARTLAPDLPLVKQTVARVVRTRRARTLAAGGLAMALIFGLGALVGVRRWRHRGGGKAGGGSRASTGAR